MFVANYENKTLNKTYEIRIVGDYALVFDTETKDTNEFQRLYVGDLDSVTYMKQVAYNWFEREILPIIRERANNLAKTN